MYVLVRYLKPEIGAYAGNDYCYRTELPLVVGDRVIAPTAKDPHTRAYVTFIHAKSPNFVCREITEYDSAAEPEHV